MSCSSSGTVPRDDAGFALITVIGGMFVLTAFLLATLGYAVQNLKPSRDDQSGKAAVAAAQAGIDEFISRLNVDDGYWTDNSADATTPDTTNAAFTTGRAVPGTSGAGAQFRYRVLTTSEETALSGIIRLESTGTTGGRSRSLIADLQPDGFLRYLYLTDVEAQDPALWVPNPPPVRYDPVTGGTGSFGDGDRDKVAAACSQYYYTGRSSPSYPVTVNGVDYTARFNCSEIQFTSGDVIQGPLHSNDALLLNGSPLFTSAATQSSWPDGSTPAPGANRWWTRPGNPGAPSAGTPAAPGFRPVYAPPLPLPVSNSELKTFANPATGPGCLYTGATRIEFTGQKMRVNSPWSTGLPARCSGAGEFVDTPPVLYVDGQASCTGKLPGFPLSGEAAGSPGPDYSCQKGNAYVEGNVSSKVTVAASNDIVITGDLKYASGGGAQRVVGLIADNYVWVYNPVNTAGTNMLPNNKVVHQIDGAILALRHSFLVQNYDEGGALSGSATTSKLNVTGAIAQKFRGPVGTGSGSTVATGYLKNYVYDPRLLNLPPPYFLKPVSSPWVVSKISD